MERVLPNGWVETELGSVSEIVTGNTPSKSVTEYYGDDILWVKPGDFHEQKVIFKTAEKLSELGFQKSRKVPAGSILVTCIGNLGNISMASEDLATNQQINSIVIPHDKLSKKYIYYYSLTLKKWLIDNSTSTTISMVNKSVFEKAPLIFPALAEQERIVAKLDKLFAQHEKIKKSLDSIPKLLKTFRQQVLIQAVTGKLTEKWREGKDLDEWKIEKAEHCCLKVQSGGTPKGSKFTSSGIPFLKVYNIVNNKIDFDSEPQYVSEEIHTTQIKKSIAYPGDVIMNIVGPPLNKIAILTNQYPEWNLNQAITIFRVKEYLNNRFLYYFFCEGTSVKSLGHDLRGVVGQANISLSQCRNFDIPIPSLQEQQEIVRQVESLFAKADLIESRSQTLKAKVDALPQAILHKAFKGELVPQLPTDGDANDLLADIIRLKGEVKPKIARKKHKVE